MRSRLLHPALAALGVLLAAPPARAQLGIDLTPDEKQDDKKPDRSKQGEKRAPEKKAPDAAKPPPPQQPQAPVTLPELDIGAGKKGEAARRLADARKPFESKDYELAALAYDAILREPALAEVHDEARLGEAKSLERLGLHHSALSRLDEILAKGPQGSTQFKDALDWYFHVGKELANEDAVVARVVRYAGASLPPGSQDRFNYLLARNAYERGKALEDAGQGGEARRAYAEARRLSALVRPDAGTPTAARAGGEEGDVYAKARFLDGLVLYAEGNGNAALESFKDVVRLTNPRRARAPDPRTRELAFLQLARLHYEHKQNRYAIFYYDKMPWGGDSWLEGLWESSYAHYRIGDYEKSLGNLLTLQSPYFREEWFPESWILKAIIYYENCRYPEARAILDEFHALYEPVHGELDRLTARQVPPSGFFDLIEDVQKGRGAGGQMRRIMKAAFTDNNVKRLDEAILEVEAEMDKGLGARREAFRNSSLAVDLKSRLGAERKRLVDEAGARARAKLEYERDALKDLLQQALRIKIEVSRKEREALESSLARGGPVDVIRDYRYSVAVSDEHQYWPYDGEFWRDELGTYTYTLTKGCRDTGAPGTRAAAR
jgi:tetratricopeptide (TPR) repeat protein